MKKYTTKVACFLAAAALAVSCTNDPADMGNSTEDVTVSAKICMSPVGAIQGRLLVKFAPEATKTLSENITRSGNTRSGIAKFDEIMKEIDAVSVERIYPVDQSTEEQTVRSGLNRWHIVHFDTKAALEQAARKFASLHEVEIVEYDHEVVPIGWSKEDIYSGIMNIAGDNENITRAAAKFNDPKLARQWHYINDGNTSLTTPIKAGCDVNCGEAWELCTGDPSIIVAVVDGGVMYSHEDLAANMWINSGEVGGAPNTDNDGNGYKNDVNGYNFVISSSNISFTYHGTHVAGTVSAVNNNGIGVSGIAGGSGNNDGVKIMSCQVFLEGNGGGASAEQMGKAIKYAADNGAVILQCSWGVKSGAIADDNAFANRSKHQKEAIDYFIANAGKKDPNSPISGGIVIFAAGNDGKGNVGYPGAYSKVIGVTSLASDFTPASYTNFGTAADIAAPGGDQAGYYNSNNAGQIFSTTPAGNKSDYTYSIGTSMACPHVSGVAALGLSYAKKLGKKFTADEFKGMVLASVNSIDTYMVGIKNYTPYEDAEGNEFKGVMDLANDYYKKMGMGYADAYKLLLAVKGTPAVNVTPNESKTIDLTTYFGGISNYPFLVMVPDDDKTGLDYTVNGTKLTFKCTKRGSVIISIIVKNGDANVTREVAVICREGYTGGGWM